MEGLSRLGIRIPANAKPAFKRLGEVGAIVCIDLEQHQAKWGNRKRIRFLTDALESHADSSGSVQFLPLRKNAPISSIQLAAGIP